MPMLLAQQGEAVLIPDGRRLPGVVERRELVLAQLLHGDCLARNEGIS